MILTITLNPAVDQTLYVDGLKPHDTNRVQSMEVDAGGKGINLSRVAVALGVESIATGYLGGATGDTIRSVMQREGVTDRCLTVPGLTRTVFSIESGDGPPTTFNLKGTPVTEEDWMNLCAVVEEIAPRVKWVAMGGSLPPGLPADSYARLAKIAKEAGAKVLIDADGEAMKHALEFPLDLIKPNGPEAERLVGRTLSTTPQIAEAAQELRRNLIYRGAEAPLVIISRGKEGAVLADEAGTHVFQAIPVKVKSTIGSGDSMLAGFLVGQCLGKSHDASMRLAIAAGAATAMSDGAHIGSREDVLALLAKQN